MRDAYQDAGEGSFIGNAAGGKDTPYVSIQRGNESPAASFIHHDDRSTAGAAVDRKKSWTDAASECHSDEAEKSPMTTAIYNMLAGCGLVGLPLQTKQAGIIPGMLLMAVVAVFSVYTLRLLIQNARRQKVRVSNYEDLCKHCWGVWGYYNLIASILLFDVGQCLTYSIILGSSAHDVFSQILGWSSAMDKKLIIIGSYIFFLFPFSIGKDFRFIEKISAFAIFSIVFMIGVVTYEYWHTYRHDDVKVHLFSSSPTDIIQAFGAIAFAFSQQDQTFLVYKTLYNPTTRRYTILASWAMGIQFLLCSTVGLFGYLSFGHDVQDVVLENYPHGNHLLIATRVIYVSTMVFIFPTAFYVVRHIFYSCVFYHSDETYEKATLFWRLVFTIGLLSFFCVLSLFLDDLGLVMTLTGLLAVVNITFILPCWIHLKLTEYPVLFWRAPPGEKWNAITDTWPSVFLLIFGVLSCVIGIIGMFV
eukprot:CAMPEP_0197027716 /NCGR_PEP_ID=MMETSP1384-20130603/7589_1 /TAXON_ID=29189 /ORGANISM="Ammonia sp." /LENGTH=473 /DNA_ID=CAMNT_0042456607 /DNA_START=29 /DNA_END=1450 /DNA_ORIENTATION=-